MQNSFLNISIKTLNLFLKKLLAETKLVKLSKDSEKKAEIAIRYHEILYPDFQHNFFT